MAPGSHHLANAVGVDPLRIVSGPGEERPPRVRRLASMLSVSTRPSAAAQWPTVRAFSVDGTRGPAGETLVRSLTMQTGLAGDTAGQRCR
ncbi:LytR/CspA/Psr family protein (plasmid) [Thermomicrobium roseum DSM 5159]|uniref:LytR/CspA/Psr family protein n=1 Tax=Thermomicrobium roseum (strain ATCC 27502 / DSM 5159 / P-2) TaxID=309801 RepID=B9L589_THERP|nr:LytR/CspA/Psr family protein [Thermomicrobium roseum DSM 5159]